MKIALLTTFKASRKDPLGESLERIHSAFPASGEGEPTVRFRFSDSPLGMSASIVDRAIKRQPELVRFLFTPPAVPITPDIRQLSNFPACPAASESVPFATLPPAGEAIFAACGKVKSTVQVPFAAPQPTTSSVHDVVVAYRTRLSEILQRANLPHELPSAADIRMESAGLTSGPKKPALESAFSPMGYTCRGESGTFTLRRRTSSNLTVEKEFDVGTWSNSLTAGFRVYGLGFSAMLPMPVSRHTMSGQYPIGGAARWQRIVENLAALTREFDREFVPAIEAAAGPSPERYKPDS